MWLRRWRCRADVVVAVVVAPLAEDVLLTFCLRGSLDGLNATLLGSYLLIGDLLGNSSFGSGEFVGPVERVLKLISSLGVGAVINVILAE